MPGGRGPRREGGRSHGAPSRILLLAILGIAPFLHGGVPPWSFAILTGAILVPVAALVAGRLRRGERSSIDRRPLWLLLSLAAIGTLQFLPLPRRFIATVSPDRVKAHRVLAPPEGVPLGPYERVLRAELAPPRWLATSFAADRTRLDTIALVLFAGVFFVSSETLRRRRDLERLAIVVTAAGALASVLGLLRHYGGPAPGYSSFPFPQTASPFGPFTNRNHFAGFVELALPLAFGLATVSLRDRRRDPARALLGLSCSGAAILVMAAALWACGSRAGLALALAGLLVFAGLLLYGGGRERRRSLLALALLAAIAVTALTLAGGGRVLSRLTAIDRTDGSVETRLAVWQSAVAVFRAYPTLGVGYGAFAAAAPRYQDPSVHWYFEHPESDYLQLLAEGGVPAALAGALLLGLLAARTWRRIRLDADGEGGEAHVWRSAAAAAIAVLLVHATVDVNLHIPANGALFFALAAVLASPERATDARGVPPRRPRAAAAVVLAAAAAALGLARVAAGDFCSVRARTDERPGAPAGSERAWLERALVLSPGRADFHHRLGRKLSRAALGGGAPPDPVEAFRHLARAAAIRPTDGTFAFELGWLAGGLAWAAIPPYPGLGLWGERTMRYGAGLNPFFAEARIRLGYYLTVIAPGGVPSGLAEIRSGLTLLPDDQYLVLDILERRLPRPLVTRAIPDRAYDRFLYAAHLDDRGETEEALGQYRRSLALARPQPLARARHLALVAGRHSQARREELALPLWEEALADAPDDPDLLFGRGTSLQRLGRLAAAREALAQAAAGRRRSDIDLELARTEFALGDHPAAIAAAARIPSSAENYASALQLIGLAHEQRGELGKAFTALRRAVALAPDGVEVREQLARVEREMAKAFAPPQATSSP